MRIDVHPKIFQGVIVIHQIIVPTSPLTISKIVAREVHRYIGMKKEIVIDSAQLVLTTPPPKGKSTKIIIVKELEWKYHALPRLILTIQLKIDPDPFGIFLVKPLNHLHCLTPKKDIE